MNCEEVRASLSLYVAGDVQRHGEREKVDAHLRECASCRAAAGEWEASRQLLHLHQPPEFDAAFFDSVRRGVMRQISEPRPSLLARLLGQPFGQRALTYAAAFSVLVCAVILSSHFLRRAPTTPVVEVVKEDEGGHGKAGADDTQEMRPRKLEGVKKSNESAAPRPPTNPARRREARQTDVALKRDARRGERLATRRQARDEEEVADSLRSQRHSVSPEVVPEAAGSANRVETVASADREMLRIELQTADPNIRIIWLSPKTADSASSNKPNR